MKTKCPQCDKEMDWKDVGATTIPAHAIYRNSEGELEHSRVSLVFCSLECTEKFAKAMLETVEDFRKGDCVSPG